MIDREGVIYKGRKTSMNPYKAEYANDTNCRTLADAIKGADVFIGLSSANKVTEDMVKSMAPDPVIFAMANPDPEIVPALAFEAGARIVGTGRSDYDNQINNVLAFPGIFRGALDARASDINEEMKIAAAYAIAEIINEESLTEDHVIPSALDQSVVKVVAKAVYQAAIDSGVARI